jgi:hypothetical protein
MVEFYCYPWIFDLYQEELRPPLQLVVCVAGSSSQAPDSGALWASRSTKSSGNAQGPELLKARCRSCLKCFCSCLQTLLALVCKFQFLLAASLCITLPKCTSSLGAFAWDWYAIIVTPILNCCCEKQKFPSNFTHYVCVLCAKEVEAAPVAALLLDHPVCRQPYIL